MKTARTFFYAYYSNLIELGESLNLVYYCSTLSYEGEWNIIDERWDSQFHGPLHTVGYFLNAELHYVPNFKVDTEVKIGLLQCIQKMAVDPKEQLSIDKQLEDFKNQNKLFGNPLAVEAIGKKTLAVWWQSYGDENKELQLFVIHVLSLTCSSSKCEHNWSEFEMVRF